MEGAFARSAAREAAPTVAGAGAGLAGMEGGAALGALTSPITGPVGPIVGGAAGLLAGGFGGSWLASKGQDWVLDKLGLKPSIDAQQAVDEAQHPYASEAGGLVDGLLAFGVGGAGGIVNRGINAGIMGVQEAGQEYAHNGTVDPTKVGMSAVAGAAIGAPRALTKVLPNAVTDAVTRFKGGGVPSTAPSPDSVRPDMKAPDAEAQKDDIEVANDITTTSAGVAADNPPVPTSEVTTGNVTGAPMLAREGARPSDPERNYGKGSVAGSPGVTTAPTEVGVNTDALHPDVAAALGAHNENNPSPAQPDTVARTPNSVPGDTTAVAPGEQAQPRPVGASPDVHGGSGADTIPVKTGIAEAAGQPQAPQQAVRQTPNEQAGPVELQGQGFPKRPVGQAAIDAAYAATKDMPKVKAALDAAPADQRAILASRILHLNESKTGDALGTAEPRVPSKRPTLDSGMTARSKGDLARKKGAVAAWEGAYKKFGPDAGDLDPTDRKAIVDRATQAVAAARASNKGIDPLESYKPPQKPNEYKWLKAARAVVAKPTGANIKSFLAAHALGGETGQDVDAEIAMKRRPTVENAEIGAEAPASSRPTFEHFHDPDEAGFYNDQQNHLRSWLNNLNDVDYQLIANEHPDLEANLRTTQDPEELHRNLQDDLSMAQNRTPGRAGVGDRVAPEEVAGIERPIRNKGDLDRFAPTPEGGAASTGRSLTGAERDAAIAALGKPKDNAGRLETEEAAVRDPNSGTHNATLYSGLPLQGGYDALATKLKKWGQSTLPSWAAKRFGDPTSPARSPEVREYAEQLGDKFNALTNRAIEIKKFLNANSMLAPDIKANEWEQIYAAMENRGVRSLSPRLRKAYAEVVAPLKGKYNDLYDEMAELNKTHSLGLDLPDRLIQGPSKDHVPRLKKGDPTNDQNTEIDPVTGRTLTNNADTLKNRDFFALENKTGDRMLFKRDADSGDITILRNGAPTVVKKLPDGFTGSVGDAVDLKVKGKTDSYTVDHATTKEIEANVKDENGKNLEYVKNPVLSYSNAIDGLHAAVENANTLAEIKNDPRFIDNTTTKIDEARERGYSLLPTNLPQLAARNGKTLYMPKSMKWALDDFHRPGLLPANADWARRLNTNLARVFYTFGPAIHALNEFDNWWTSRGFDWISPPAWKTLATTGFKAIRSVHTQDEIQHAIMEAGGNPMLGSALTRDLLPQMAKRMGVDMGKNRSQWDPIAKAFGISTPELGRAMYNTSSKGMWYANDIFLTQRVLENMERRGMSLPDAVKDAHNFISDYRLPSTVGGSGNISRTVSQVLADPALSLFGRYHYGLFKSYGHMLSKLLGPSATSQERVRAAGQLLTSAALAYYVYPKLDDAAKAITGNSGAEFGRRGLSTIPRALSDVYNGRKGVQALTPDVFTPSIPLNTGMQALTNHDFRGKEIVQQNDLSQPGNLAKAAGQEGDFLARQLISPYGTLAGAAESPGATPASVAGKFAGNMVGIKQPSDASNKFMDRIQKFNAQQAKAREKKPQGLIEGLANWAARNSN